MTTVRQHQNPHTFSEPRQLEIQLVVYKLRVEEAPGLIELVLLFSGDIGDLPAMAGEGEEEQVTGPELRCRCAESGEHPLPGRALRQQNLRLHSSRFRDGGHVLRVEFARREITAPP